MCVVSVSALERVCVCVSVTELCVSECLYVCVYKYESCECAHTRAGWSQESGGRSGEERGESATSSWGHRCLSHPSPSRKKQCQPEMLNCQSRSSPKDFTQSKNINLKNFCDFDQKLSHLKTSGPVNLWLRDRLWGLFPETQVPYVTPLLIVYTNSFELCPHFITPQLGKSSQEKSLQCTHCSCKHSIYEIENTCRYLKVIEKDAHVHVGLFTQQSNVQSAKQHSWMFYFMYTQGKVENRRQSTRVKRCFSTNTVWNPQCMKGLVAKVQKKFTNFNQIGKTQMKGNALIYW